MIVFLGGRSTKIVLTNAAITLIRNNGSMSILDALISYGANDYELLVQHAAQYVKPNFVRHIDSVAKANGITIDYNHVLDNLLPTIDYHAIDLLLDEDYITTSDIARAIYQVAANGDYYRVTFWVGQVRSDIYHEAIQLARSKHDDDALGLLEQVIQEYW
jgi:hypothetical protein